MDLSKKKYPVLGIEEGKKHSLRFFKAMKSKRNNKWGWYRFKCWQFILSKLMESEGDSMKGMNMF